MSFDENKRTGILIYLLNRIAVDDSEFMKAVTKQFDISATSVKRYLIKCIGDGMIRDDTDRQCGYALCSDIHRHQCELTGEQQEEDILYFEWIEPCLKQLPVNIRDIWAYACMEMLNNAIEHSGGKKLSVSIARNYLYTEVVIRDDGVGAFENVRNYIRKEFSREASLEDSLMELYKGRFTTAAERHSGEGIFFTSKMMDHFMLSANGLSYMMHAGTERIERHRLIAYYQKLNRIGTEVHMRLSNFSERRSQEIFDRFTNEDGGFVKTYIPIRDACQTEKPMARSQARRLLRRLEDFEEAVLDFAEVEFCGQGFMDEIFRVFGTAHPEVSLAVVHANQDVEKMIKHVSNFGQGDKNHTAAT